MIHLWRDLPVALAAIPQTMFVLLYALPALGAGQWWRDYIGRALFLKALTLGLLIDVATLGMVGRLLRHRPVVWGWPSESIGAATTVGYWLVAAAIIYQLVALIRERRHSHRL